MNRLGFVGDAALIRA